MTTSLLLTYPTNLQRYETCPGEFHYFAGHQKLYFHPSRQEIWINFNRRNITLEQSAEILSDYTFIKRSSLISENFYSHDLIITIESVADCKELKQRLALLNHNSKIFSATPVFYHFTHFGQRHYQIVTNEIIAKPFLTNDTFHQKIKALQLDVIEKSIFGTFVLRTRLNHGFEAIDKANELYQSGLMKYAQPDLIRPLILPK
ncbi:MAG: hypothetical protein ACNS62_14030 [Candidatus Cyclobacteriaceae bacterium M3_2C_046]